MLRPYHPPFWFRAAITRPATRQERGVGALITMSALLRAKSRPRSSVSAATALLRPDGSSFSAIALTNWRTRRCLSRIGPTPKANTEGCDGGPDQGVLPRTD